MYVGAQRVDPPDHGGGAHGAVGAAPVLVGRPAEDKVRQVEAQRVAGERHALVAGLLVPGGRGERAVHLSILQDQSQAGARRVGPQASAFRLDHGLPPPALRIVVNRYVVELVGAGRPVAHKDAVAVHAGVEHAGLQVESGAFRADVLPQIAGPVVGLRKHHVVEVRHASHDNDRHDERRPDELPERDAGAFNDRVVLRFGQPAVRHQGRQQHRHGHGQHEHVR